MAMEDSVSDPKEDSLLTDSLISTSLEIFHQISACFTDVTLVSV